MFMQPMKSVCLFLISSVALAIFFMFGDIVSSGNGVGVQFVSTSAYAIVLGAGVLLACYVLGNFLEACQHEDSCTCGIDDNDVAEDYQHGDASCTYCLTHND